MAEGWLRHLLGDQVESLSAGADPAGVVHPLAISVMAEVGIDISRQRSKSIEEFLPDPPDIVISVCEQAAQNCPNFPGKVQRLTWPLDDPAKATGTEEDRVKVFRRVRDEIRAKIDNERQLFGL